MLHSEQQEQHLFINDYFQLSNSTLSKLLPSSPLLLPHPDTILFISTSKLLQAQN
jgi:hypothetical protein